MAKSLAVLSLLGTILLAGCQNGHPAPGPEIHGKVGVRVESRDTHRLRPVQE